MTAVLSTATCSGPHRYLQAQVKPYVQAWLNGAGPAHERVVRSFDHTLVRERSSVEPIDWVFSRRGLQDSNDRYKHHAAELATRVAGEALERADLEPTDVDYLISTSCTGIMIPSVDAVVAERLGMKCSLRRLPITEHGCAAGAVALSQAHDYLLAHPGHKVLLVAVELPSLTFQTSDRSAANIISAAIFGDGAAAVVLGGEDCPGMPHVVRTASHRFPDSLDWMGFELKDQGLTIVLSAKIPLQVRESAPPVIDGFLADSGLTRADLSHFLLHPGGRKILEAFEDTLDLHDGELDVSRHVLRENGNLSSATVLFILEEAVRRELGQPGDLGLMMAFGPGFGAELLLLEWR